MASVFDGSLPVAELSRARQWRTQSSPRTILWPVWVRRVVAPLGVESRIGPFERAVLGCAHAGVQDHEHIAGLLCIDPKLVRAIQSVLRQHRALSDSMSLTEDGLAMLRTGELDTSQIKVAHVFACAISGRLIPRVAERVSFAEVCKEGRRYIHVTGSEGSSRRHPCVHISPPTADEPPVPDAVEVFAAIRRHFAAHRNYEEFGEAPSELDAVPEVTRPSALARISVIDRRATPMFLLTRVYDEVPSPSSGEYSRSVADPWGFGELAVFTRSLVELCSHCAELKNALKPKAVRSESALGSAASWDELVAEARRIVSERAPNVRADCSGFQHLVDMEEARYAWELSGSSRPDASRFLREAARNARSAIEACFVSLSKAYPLSRLAERIRRLENGPAGAVFLAAKIEARLADVGFQVPPPRRFVVRPNDLRSVVCYQQHHKVGALVIATAIVASETPGHPFADLAKRCPNLLEQLDSALETAGAASHHEEGRKIEPDAVEELVNLVYQLWNGLVGCLPAIQ